MLNKTHAFIDGKTHKIASIDEHATGPRHTHRVHLGCGLQIDVDLEGKRHAAAALEHEELADRADQHEDLNEAALRRQKVDELRELSARHRAAHTDSKRWLDNTKATCKDCIKHEAGAPALNTGINHCMPTTVLADIKTGLPCPVCNSDLYIRRKDGTVACTAYGHEYAIPEIIATTMGLLHRLATGKLS